jgi:hypothetical protein
MLQMVKVDRQNILILACIYEKQTSSKLWHVASSDSRVYKTIFVSIFQYQMTVSTCGRYRNFLWEATTNVEVVKRAALHGAQTSVLSSCNKLIDFIVMQLSQRDNRAARNVPHFQTQTLTNQ